MTGEYLKAKTKKKSTQKNRNSVNDIFPFVAFYSVYAELVAKAEILWDRVM